MKPLAITLTFLACCGVAAAQSEAYQAGQQKSAACAGCHGVDGNSMVPMFPKLAGLESGYIVRQLKAFKAGTRTDPVMGSFAMGLSEQDMKDIAAYYSAHRRTLDIPGAPPEVIARGEDIYRGTRKNASIPACSGCHGSNGDGMPQAPYPYLRGQHAQYIAKQLRDFKTEARKTDAAKMMRITALRMTEEDIDAVAHYIAGLK